ncbi:MAG: hypothetical protein L6Q69_23345, partial [Zoogloea sp.]|nr:hypothetical protein [Zoogloea sp.]
AMDVLVSHARLGRVDERTWRFRRRDGTTLPVQLSVSTLLHSQSQVKGCRQEFSARRVPSQPSKSTDSIARWQSRSASRCSRKWNLAVSTGLSVGAWMRNRWC